MFLTNQTQRHIILAGKRKTSTSVSTYFINPLRTCLRGPIILVAMDHSDLMLQPYTDDPCAPTRVMSLIDHAEVLETRMVPMPAQESWHLEVQERANDVNFLHLCASSVPTVVSGDAFPVWELCTYKVIHWAQRVGQG